MKKIGVFGGVFNPPHKSHINVATEILKKQPEFEKIIFVPVGNKYKKTDIINAEDRYNMLKLACKSNKKFEVSRIEIEQSKQFYAFETLDELKKTYPDYDLTFIIGTDSLKTLDTWKNLDYLLTNYSFLVYPRGNDNYFEIINNNLAIKKYLSNINYIDTKNISDLSSTYIRDRIKNNEDVKHLLPNNVFKYICDNNLYKN